MGYEIDAREQYQAALKAGKKQYREDIHNGNYPYLQVLDEILDGSMIAGQLSLGLLEIPSKMIVGTKTAGRTTAFASNFMPLLSEGSEFGAKWMQLCSAHLSDEGIRDPIKCYEYLGRFYVLEGNKRVSVFKSYGAPSIPAYVTRLIPTYSDDEEIRSYYEFMRYYPLTKLYQLRFTQPGSFPKLQTALGYEVNHKWTEDEKRVFLSGFYNFETAFNRLKNPALQVTAADALLVWLKVYPFDDLRFRAPSDLTAALQTIWQDIGVLVKEEPIEVSTEPNETEPETNFLEKLKTSVFPTKSRLKIAFIHELTPRKSNWVRSHEVGRKRMEAALGDQVETVVYMDVGNAERADTAMEDAIKDGAQVIFTTTPPLIGACRKAAVQHPDVKILNCSVSMPYTGVRTYYGRIYEGKFISGAIAGAISRNDHIGYIASYPIFGVPAGINAFALGAQLTNPRARIDLRWSCVPGDHLDEMKEMGIDVVSTLDIPVRDWESGNWGTFKIKPDGTTEILASPYWNWGTFYIKLVRSILDGSWDSLNSSPDGQRAINYWWGMASGVVGIKRTNAIPAGVSALAKIIQNSIVNDSITPFHRPILSQDGVVRNDGSRDFTYEEILNMDWLCDNVDGGIPEFDILTPKGQAIARLQGIYRDDIPPEIEGVLL